MDPGQEDGVPVPAGVMELELMARRVEAMDPVPMDREAATAAGAMV
jgi:hypothetical protein